MIHFGTVPLGRILEAGGEHVHTYFVCFLGPLVPIRSEYHRGDIDPPIKVPLNSESVLLGYLRNWLGLVTVLCALVVPSMAIYGFAVESMPRFLLPVGAVLIATAMLWAVTMRMGRCTNAERRARHMLKLTTGTGAFPSMLFSEQADEHHRALQQRWEQSKPGRDWRHRFGAGSLTSIELPLLFSLAIYEAAMQRDEKANKRARVAWDMVEDHWQFDEAEL